MKTVKSTLVKSLRLALVGLCLATLATAQSDSTSAFSYRAERWDWNLNLQYAGETDYRGAGGSKVSIDDDLGFGLAAGYNFNDHFQLGGRFNFDSRGYDATTVGNDGARRSYQSSVDSTLIELNPVFYFLPGHVTPFISGSLGYAFMDTNIQNGPAEEVCYWDPWWGYVCSTYVPTRTEDGLSYGGGVGLRVDINELFSLQCSYNKLWIDVDNAAGTPDFDSVRLDFIFRPF